MSSRIDLDLQDEILLKDFKKFVKEIHEGKFRKFYRYEIRQAFKFYLAANHVGKYPQLVKKEIELNYLLLPDALHTHRKPVYDQTHVIFLTKFFQTYLKTKKPLSKSEVVGFIKSSLLIKDKRAVDGWIDFLEDLGWISNKRGRVEGGEVGLIIDLSEKSLFKLLGEDPTGTYRPYNNEISKIFNAQPVSYESNARVRRN